MKIKRTKSPNIIRASLASLLLWSISVLPTNAQDGFEIPDEVDDVLKSMSTFVGEVGKFSFTAEVLFDEVLPSGQKIEHNADITVITSRPDHLAARFVGEENVRSLWIAGEKLTALHETNGVYSKIKVPSGNGPALDHLMKNYDVSLPLADFVIENAYESLVSNVDEAIYAGLTEIDGHDCHHIACSQEFIDWQLWIDDGLEPFPRKVVITYKAVPGAPRYSATFNEWDLDGEFSDSVFDSKIPSDAVKIDMLKTDRSSE